MWTFMVNMCNFRRIFSNTQFEVLKNKSYLYNNYSKNRTHKAAFSCIVAFNNCKNDDLKPGISCALVRKQKQGDYVAVRHRCAVNRSPAAALTTHTHRDLLVPRLLGSFDRSPPRENIPRWLASLIAKNYYTLSSFCYYCRKAANVLMAKNK